MGYVKYKTDKYGRFFDIAENLKEIWGVQSTDILVGLKLKDRKNPKHVVTIEKIYEDLGIVMVQWKEGGWNCLDHALEQFEKQ